MTFSTTEHAVKSARYMLSGLRSGNGAASDLRPWLARALALLAAPVAGVRCAGLSLHRARHARLYEESFDKASEGFEANIRNVVKAAFRMSGRGSAW